LSNLQFIRNYLLEIDDASGSRHIFKELRISFDVVQSLWGHPGISKVIIYNLSRDNISRLREANSKIRLAVSHGANEPKTLFMGRVVNVLTLRQNETSVTEFYCVDSLEAMAYSHISKSWNEKTPLKKIVQDVMDVMIGVTGGSLSALDGIITRDFETGFGNAVFYMDYLAEAYGFWWTIQLGEMFIIKKNGALLDEDTIVINKNSGMIGSPTITEIGIHVSALLNPAHQG
jgi:hypothetical protein